MKSVLLKTSSVIICVLVVFIVILSFGIFSDNVKKGSFPSENNVSQLSSKKSADENTSYVSYTDMLSVAVKSVVGVSGKDATHSTAEYIGSGVLVSEDGYIITNHHVVGKRPERVEITLHSGETVEGKTVWSDAAMDIAVVKIKGNGYPFSKMGDAKKLRVGERVTAIGNPLSLRFERSVTSGIVSAVGRSIELENENGDSYYMEDLIQTDASINPGNSGGPLLDSSGNIVGINTVKVSTAEGMGFAVPVNVCVPVIESLCEKGKFVTPYLGLYAYTPAAARYFGKKESIRDGIFAAKLDPDGPAFEAGLRYGDIIMEVNAKKVTTMLDLREELYRFQSGDTVEIKYKRGKNYKTAKIKLTNA